MKSIIEKPFPDVELKPFTPTNAAFTANAGNKYAIFGNLLFINFGLITVDSIPSGQEITVVDDFAEKFGCNLPSGYTQRVIGLRDGWNQVVQFFIINNKITLAQYTGSPIGAQNGIATSCVVFVIPN